MVSKYTMGGVTMNCHKVQNLLSAYIDSEIPGVEMLAVRRHLSECEECNATFEALLHVKRSLGRLAQKCPSEWLADRICQQINHLPPATREPVRASVRRHVTFFPTRLKFAGVCMSAIAFLLMLRSGGMITDYYMDSVHSPIQVGSLQLHNVIHPFSAAPLVETEHGRISAQASWGLPGKFDRPGSTLASSNMSLASYSFSGR